MADLHAELRLSNPRLSRFDPLPRILTFDDFDRGYCGWTHLVGNYEGSLDTMTPSYAAHTHPQLSTVIHWDAGSHGSVDGSYALKIATRPQRGLRSTAIKRLTFRQTGPIRLEAYFCFKPEATELSLSETDVRSFGFLYDLQTGDLSAGTTAGNRVMPHIRFLNAEDGQHVQRWQYKDETTPLRQVGSEGKTVTHDHLHPLGWKDIPGGHQKLCYNELPTKINWHYLRFDFDLMTMRMVELHCNDRRFDLKDIPCIVMPAMRNLWCMLNVVFFVEAERDKRAFLYLDSVCLSAEA